MRDLKMKVAAVVAAMAVACGMAVAQSAPVLGADGKPLAFDVVSIKENQEANRPGPPVFGPTPSGYHMVGLPLALVVLAAYVPQSGSDFFNPNDIVGVQNLEVMRTRYDIDARVGEADMPAWQDATKQPAMLRAMLQQMLAERFKMVAHREMKEKPVFNMVAGKGRSKLKPSVTGDLNLIREKHPNAGQLPGGMVIVEKETPGSVQLYNASMASFGTLLSQMAGRVIVDKTGLTGRYDIELTLDMAPAPGSDERPDRATMIITALQEQLGLKLEAAKTEVETLVVDHAEKPTEN